MRATAAPTNEWQDLMQYAHDHIFCLKLADSADVKVRHENANVKQAACILQNGRFMQCSFEARHSKHSGGKLQGAAESMIQSTAIIC